MAAKKTKRRKADPDINVLAHSIVARATGEATREEDPEPESVAEPGKNPAAVALGRLGGLKGGKARAESLSAKKRSAIAKRAAKVRWGGR